MSEATLPHLIEPGKWADREALLDAVVPLRRFGRLLEGALGNEGDVSVKLRFVRDARGLPHLTGQLGTVLSLTCQCCLDAVTIPVTADVDVFMLSDEAYADRLGEDEDYVVFNEGHLDFPELLEDELILALPLVARHDDCEPQAILSEPEEVVVAPVKKENPFQVLASLKQPDSE